MEKNRRGKGVGGGGRIREGGRKEEKMGGSKKKERKKGRTRKVAIGREEWRKIGRVYAEREEVQKGK